MKQGRFVKMLADGRIGQIEYVIPFCMLETAEHGDYCRVRFDVLTEKWCFEDEFEILS